MYRNSKFTFEEKLKVVKLILNNKTTINHQAYILSCGRTTIREWMRKYKTFKKDGLKINKVNRIYSKEIKILAVKEYLSGNESLNSICNKYQILSPKQLRSWILLYNNNIELKSRGCGIMKIKGVRKNLTFEDRIEIVKHYLEISNNYTETAIKFQVSYQQVYKWVQKFNKCGIDALIDRRGKRKSVDEMSEVDKLKLENKILKAKYRRIELENALLKKLNELEGV